MAEEKEKIYTIPLRREWLKAPKYKRAKKASKAIKEYLARHLKLRGEGTDKIKLDPLLNDALWCRGIKKPPHKISVKVKKQEDKFMVTFVSLPRKFKEEDKELKKKQKKIEQEKARKEKEKEKKKKEEEEKKKAEEKKKEEKTEEEKKEEEDKKEKDKLLKKQVPVEKGQKFIKPTKTFGVQHRKALEK
jgi:large subunit ribosomal protein L31e